MAPPLLSARLSRGRFGFIERNDFRFFGKTMTVGRQLGAHGSIGGAGIFAGTIDEMHQHAATLDMTKKAIAETDALVSTLNQARNVGEHEFAAVGVDNAELRMER